MFGPYAVRNEQATDVECITLHVGYCAVCLVFPPLALTPRPCQTQWL